MKVTSFVVTEFVNHQSLEDTETIMLLFTDHAWINVAWNRSSYQISTHSVYAASCAADGFRYTTVYNPPRTCAHTNYDSSPWWAVDMGYRFYVQFLFITNRAENI